MFPCPEQDWPDGKMQLVDEASAQILPDCGDAAAQANVAAAGSRSCLLEGMVNAFSDEPELRTSHHRHRRAGVVREDEDRRVVRRLVAPPALPAVVRPGTPDRTEH